MSTSISKSTRRWQRPGRHRLEESYVTPEQAEALVVSELGGRA